MKEQVTSIEQSKRLIELGVPAEKASMIYQSYYTQGVPKLYAQYYQRNGYPPKEKIREDVIPAFTVADMIDMLPITCGHLHIHIEEITNSHKFIYYEGRGDIRDEGYVDLQTVLFVENSLVESCVEAIEWVIYNNYNLNI